MRSTLRDTWRVCGPAGDRSRSPARLFASPHPRWVADQICPTHRLRL